MPKRNRNARGGNKGVSNVRRRKLAGQAAPRRKAALDKKAQRPGVDFQGKSRLESAFGTFLRRHGIEFGYESQKLGYQLKPQYYLPDFDVEGMIFETKGYFPNQDRQKMRAVLACNPDIDLYMVFSNPEKTIRKNSKTTYGEWCTEHGIPWLGVEELKKLIEEDPKGYVSTLRRRKKGMELREYYGRGVQAIARAGHDPNARAVGLRPDLAAIAAGNPRGSRRRTSKATKA